MDELLAQFLIESRELVDKAVDDLLALEKAPHDLERFEEVFRAFHTLKGGAGIVEFAAMQEALHSAEDALAAARAESRQVSAGDIGNCLACLDRVVEWLSTIEQSGAIPRDVDARDIVALFARSGVSAPVRSASTAPDDSWVQALLDVHAAAATAAKTALRYTPDADSFFRQEDPLARMAGLPGLLAVDIGPRTTWPTLDELDPFSCNLTITALLAASSLEVAAALGEESRRAEIQAVAGRTRSLDADSLERTAAEILEAQVRLLESAEVPPQPGRVASAGLVAANVLRHVGRSLESDNVTAAAASSIAEGRVAPLLHAITAANAAPSSSPSSAPPEAGRRKEGAQTIRVRAERIDALVRLTGELIVAKNSLGHSVKLAEQRGSDLAVALNNQHAALDRLVADLQRAVVGIRVLPLRAAFQRFPRLIREMSAELEKPAVLVINGEDTEADKAIVESIVEPLVHLLRNSLDHGVEASATRAAAGKPSVATIQLSAFRDGEHVVIEVTDDGAGIDAARVRQVANERNLAAPDAIAAMSDEEALDLIFLPGFSTAKTVTHLSGRGVGMDAVRTAVTQLGGQVGIRTAAGQGTTIRVTLPFSVLVTKVMTVEAGGQLFGIPLDAVVETLRVAKERIFAVGAARAIVLRDQTIPLVRLTDVLATSTNRADDSGPIVIAQLDGQLGGVQVDKIGERMDIILKPLDGLLSGMPGLAGSALLGDGGVLLILDLAEVIQ